MGTVGNIVLGSGSLSVDASDVGFTAGGVHLRVIKDQWMRPSMSGIGAEEAVLLDQRFMVSTYLAEPTAENLKIAWGMQVSDAVYGSGIKFYFGGKSDITYHELEFTGKAPNDKDRLVHFYRACAIEFGELGYRKGREVILPVNFEVLLDVDRNPGAQVGYLIDET